MTMLLWQTGIAQETYNGMKVQREKDGVYLVADGDKIKVCENSITVKLKSMVSVLNDNYKVIRFNKLGYIDLLVPNGIYVEDYFAKLAESGLFEVITYNVYFNPYISINDPQASNQYHLSMIYASNAWNITTGDPDVKVAVLDFEVDRQHVDIGYGLDTYTNVSTSLGWNYSQNNNNITQPSDHGTMVAGIIGAKTNNGVGVAGIAGGNNSSGVTLLTYCVGAWPGVELINSEYVDDAIIDATDDGAKVINMSFGIPSSFNPMILFPNVNDAIDYAYNSGVTMVAASGNGANGPNYNETIDYPAMHPSVISVGSDRYKVKASSSNYGIGLDLVAPGVEIYSTKTSVNYGIGSGTSFASPIVAGVAALLYSVDPGITPAEVKSALIENADVISGYPANNDGWNKYVGYGLVNAGAAVSSVNENISK